MIELTYSDPDHYRHLVNDAIESARKCKRQKDKIKWFKLARIYQDMVTYCEKKAT